MARLPLVLVVALGAGCSEPAPTWDLSTRDQLRFFMGRPGRDALSAIEDGDTISEKWTLVTVPATVLPPETVRAEVDLATPGIRVSHEWNSDSPYLDGPDHTWVRLDAITDPASTSGQLSFDRSGAAEAGVILFFTFEGEVDLYDAGEPSYLRLEVITSAGFEP